MNQKKKRVEFADYSKDGWSDSVPVNERGEVEWDKELFELSVELRKAEALEQIVSDVWVICQRLLAIENALERLAPPPKAEADHLNAERREASRKRAEEVYRRSLRGNPPAGGTRIVDAGGSVRAIKAGGRLGFTTVEQFATVSESEVAELPNCGETTIKEIRDLLADRGLSFRTDTDADTP